ncbi:MAG TPA: GH3 auxin-responsive promoter family protein [Kofleriaceae bacterium]
MRAVVKAFGAALAPAARRFEAALAAPGPAQERVREEIAARVSRTGYGRSFGVRSSADLGRLPVVDHDDLAPWLERQRSEEGPVLTADPVLFYEKTSGSSGPAKYVPYTAALRRSFSRAFAVWAHDLIARGPRFETGRIYLSVSPSFAHGEATARGVPVGMADDRDYLDGWLRRILSPFWVGVGLDRERDPERFKRLTAMALLGCADLEVISVWNPTFLTVHLELIEARRDLLAAGLRLGGERLRALMADPIDWRRVWPRLALISCWTSAAAARPAARVRELFPGVLVQGKGLLATEAPITIPYGPAGGFVPVLDEVYLELEKDGDVAPLAAARAGERYGVVVSQKAGLSRYRLGDLVEVTHMHRGVPCFDLVGRQGGVSDLVGEKLSETFVRSAIGTLDLAGSGFATLVPVRQGGRDHYVLALDRAARPADLLARDLDGALARAHHYAQARALGQLSPAAVWVSPGAAEAIARFHIRRGMKWGDIKPSALTAAAADAQLAKELT